MDTKSSKCVHLVEGGTNGSQYVNMAPMGKTSLGRVIHARKRQKTSFTNLETHGDGSGYLACDTCSSGVCNEIVPAGIVPIGNILVGNNIGFQTRTKGCCGSNNLATATWQAMGMLYTYIVHIIPEFAEEGCTATLYMHMGRPTHGLIQGHPCCIPMRLASGISGWPRDMPP